MQNKRVDTSLHRGGGGHIGNTVCIPPPSPRGYIPGQQGQHSRDTSGRDREGAHGRHTSRERHISKGVKGRGRGRDPKWIHASDPKGHGKRPSTRSPEREYKKPYQPRYRPPGPEYTFLHELTYEDNGTQYSSYLRIRETGHKKFADMNLRQINDDLCDDPIYMPADIKTRDDYEWKIYCPLFQLDWNRYKGQTDNTSIWTADLLNSLASCEGVAEGVVASKARYIGREDLQPVQLGPNAQYIDLESQPEKQRGKGADRI